MSEGHPVVEHSVKPIRDSGKSVPIFRPIRLAAIQPARGETLPADRPHHRHIFHFIDLLASSSSPSPSLLPCITLYPQEQSDAE